MDPKIIRLSDATPAPVACDIVRTDGKPLSASDFAIRDTQTHSLLIPFAAASNTRLALAVLVAPAFDQELTIYFEAAYGGMLGSRLANMTLTEGAEVSFDLSAGAGGQGCEVGTAHVADLMHYAVPALADPLPNVILSFAATVAPKTGKLSVVVSRQ